MHRDAGLPLIAIASVVSAIGLHSGCTLTDVPSIEVLKYEPVLDPISAERSGVAEVTWRLIESGEYRTAIRKIEEWEVEQANGMDRILASDLCIQEGIAYYSLGQLNEAESAYTRSIGLTPSRWEPYFHRWMTRTLLGNISGAQSDRAQGMRLNPTVFGRRYDPRFGVL